MKWQHFLKIFHTVPVSKNTIYGRRGSMFKFFKEIKEAIKEGLEEAKAEVIAENEAKEEIQNRVLSQEMPDIENISLALSCPFREMLTTGDNLRLFAFGQMDEKEKQSFRKLLYRDFEIQDEASMKQAIDKMDNMLNAEGISNTVFRAAINIYIITSSADLGFITFADYQEKCQKNIEEITMNEAIDSWEAFAEQFMEGECINNTLGRKLLQSSMKKLLNEKDSPWVIFPWHKIISKMEEQKNSYKTKDIPASLLDTILWRFSKKK